MERHFEMKHLQALGAVVGVILFLLICKFIYKTVDNSKKAELTENIVHDASIFLDRQEEDSYYIRLTSKDFNRKDAWGNLLQIRYSPPAQKPYSHGYEEVIVTSAGIDQEFGTIDDIIAKKSNGKLKVAGSWAAKKTKDAAAGTWEFGKSYVKGFFTENE